VLIRLAVPARLWVYADLLWDFAFYVLNLPPTAPRQHRHDQGSYSADPDKQGVADGTIKESFE